MFRTRKKESNKQIMLTVKAKPILGLLKKLPDLQTKIMFTQVLLFCCTKYQLCYTICTCHGVLLTCQRSIRRRFRPGRLQWGTSSRPPRSAPRGRTPGPTATSTSESGLWFGGCGEENDKGRTVCYKRFDNNVWLKVTSDFSPHSLYQIILIVSTTAKLFRRANSFS